MDTAAGSLSVSVKQFPLFPLPTTAVTNSDSGYASATSNQNQDYSSLFAASSLKDDVEDFGIDDQNEDDDEEKEGFCSWKR